jgi:hypothetical protein
VTQVSYSSVHLHMDRELAALSKSFWTPRFLTSERLFTRVDVGMFPEVLFR